jgi:hypothetical protein
LTESIASEAFSAFMKSPALGVVVAVDLVSCRLNVCFGTGGHYLSILTCISPNKPKKTSYREEEKSLKLSYEAMVAKYMVLVSPKLA